MTDKNWEAIKNITVDEFTTPCLKVVSPTAEISELEALIQKENIRHIPVQENNQLVGIISERDVFFAYGSNDREKLLAKDIMRKEPFVVSADTKLSEVAFYMSKHKYGSALVKNSDGELGIFTSIDALNALVEVLRGDILTT